MPELRRGDHPRAVGGMESGDAVVPHELVLRVRLGRAAPRDQGSLAPSVVPAPTITATPSPLDEDEGATPLTVAGGGSVHRVAAISSARAVT